MKRVLVLGTLAFLVGACLAPLGWPEADATKSSQSIELRLFTRAEIVDGLTALGIAGSPKALQRLPGADGVRVALDSGEAVEIRCDGTVSRQRLPGRITYFDSKGEPLAWYEEQRLRFADAAPDPELGNQIRVDPGGRFLVTTDGRPGRKARIYATTDLRRSLGDAPVVGSHNRVFSVGDRILLIGDPLEEQRGASVILFEIERGNLSELGRVGVPEPDVWFGGWLVAEDAKPDGSAIAFGLWRDPPMSSLIYEFNMQSHELRRVAKLSDYFAYVACDPFAKQER